MTQFLPQNLLSLFEARPPINFLPPVEDLLIDKNAKRPPITGVAEYMSLFEDPADAPPKAVIETKEQKRERKRREKEELLAYKVEQGIAKWNPTENENATEDPYRTLFVARINYETSENKLRREFETYGHIKKLSMIHDDQGKPRGYAFIEYSDKSEMHNAYKKADGIKVDGKRLVVDYERGRTQKTWLPRRLGGGKGDTRKTREPRSVIAEREGSYYDDRDDRRERRADSYRSNGGGYDRDRRDRGKDSYRGYGDRDRDRERDRDHRDHRDRDRDRGHGRSSYRSSGSRYDRR